MLAGLSLQLTLGSLMWFTCGVRWDCFHLKVQLDWSSRMARSHGWQWRLAVGWELAEAGNLSSCVWACGLTLSLYGSQPLRGSFLRDPGRNSKTACDLAAKPQNITSAVVFFWLYHTECEILVPCLGIEPLSPAVGARSPILCTTREFPAIDYD